MEISVGSSTPDPARNAFEDAVKIFRETLTNDEEKCIWLEDKKDLATVQAAVASAQKLYEDKKESNKTRKWLWRLVPKILYYSSVLDVLAASNPEYAGLAWGALKFLLRVATNHERSLCLIAKALSQIGDALPRIQITAVLYDSSAMQQAVAQVYAHIVKFFHRAMVWYNESKAKHLISSIYRPFELRFGDLVDDIARYSRMVDQLAIAESQAELRLMHLEQRELLSEVRDTRRLIIENQCLNFRGSLESRRRICEIQFSQILSVVGAVSLLDPEESLRSSRYLRNRRMSQGLGCADSAWKSQKLKDWASCSSSSFLAIKGRSLQRQELRDFALDAILLLQQLKIPVVWTLTPLDKSASPFFPIDVLKQLIFQILQINHVLLTDQSPALNAVRFQSARTEREWFDILGSVLAGLPQIFIIIDMGASEGAAGSDVPWPKAFMELVTKVKNFCPNTAVKVLVFGHGQMTSASPMDYSAVEEATLRLQTVRHLNAAARRRLRVKVSASRSQGANLLRPYLTKSTPKGMESPEVLFGS